MAIYMVEGKLGSGKSLIAVAKMRDAMMENRRVATNLDLKLEKLLPPWSNYRGGMRVPDWPSAEDLENLGKGTDEVNEDKFGLLVLDELGTWLNARAWGDKGRQALIEWLLHSRKRGWSVILIAQNVSMLDKQVREALSEFRVICKRTDRMKVPLLGVNLPKVHIAFVKYGVHPGAPVAERWFYRGKDVQDGYDTRQIFVGPDVRQAHKVVGVASYVSPKSVTRARKPRSGWVWLAELRESAKELAYQAAPRAFEWVHYGPRIAEDAPSAGVAVSKAQGAVLARLRAIPEAERWAIAQSLVSAGVLWRGDGASRRRGYAQVGD